MKILHVMAHLGGGVGKAHAAINAAMPAGVEQTYVLLEPPVDRRHVDAIGKKSRIMVTDDDAKIRRLVALSNVVQFEFWGHPSLDRLVRRIKILPSTRSACWSHVSGLFPPLIPGYLIDMVDQFVVTSPVSVPAIGECAVVNSGFGIDDPPERRSTGICYLGTVDFKKMHRGVFDAVDELKEDVEVSFWGYVGPGVEDAVVKMKHPERVRLRGHAADPARVLSEADVFLYLLRPDHYGTAENALVEAMSIGLVPVVMDNSAELAIVRHGVTGLVARSPAGAAAHLKYLASSPTAKEILSRNATREAGKPKYSPARSAEQLAATWRGLISGRIKKYA